MNFLSVTHVTALFLASFAFLATGLLVFLKSPADQRSAATSNSLWSLSVAGWAFFMALGMITGNNFIFKISWIFILLIPVTNIHFVITWLGVEKKNFFVKLGYFFVALFGLIYFLPGTTIKVQQIAYARYFPEVSGVIFLSSIIFLVYMFAQFYYLYASYRNSEGTKKRQVGYLLLASFLGYFGGMSNYLMALGFPIPYYNPFASYFLIFYPLITTYVILKYQLFDIKIIIKKTLFYSLGITLLSGFLGGVSFLSDLLTRSVPGFKFWVVPVFIASISFILGRIFWDKSKEADKLKYAFITVAAHKLRTPLTEIKLGIDFLSESLPADDKMIASMRDSNARLIEFTDQLLAVSDAEKTQGYDFKPTKLEDITDNVLGSFKSKIEEKKIKLHVHFEQDLPEVKVDKVRITSVVQYLIENAIDYTKNQININIYNYKNKNIFSIEDDGIGIPKEDQEHIFSKMYRTQGASLSDTEGIGLSLFLARNIIEGHGGNIKVKSGGKDKGSEFLFELPV